MGLAYYTIHLGVVQLVCRTVAYSQVPCNESGVLQYMSWRRARTLRYCRVWRGAMEGVSDTVAYVEVSCNPSAVLQHMA